MGDILVVIALMVLAGFVGIKFFGDSVVPSDNCPPNDNGDFCFNKDPTFYVSNGINSIPSGNYGGDNCLAVNPGTSKCFITSICPNCVKEKISCACKN